MDGSRGDTWKCFQQSCGCLELWRRTLGNAHWTGTEIIDNELLLRVLLHITNEELEEAGGMIILQKITTHCFIRFSYFIYIYIYFLCLFLMLSSDFILYICLAKIPYKGAEGMSIAWGVATCKLTLAIPHDCPAPFCHLLHQCWKQDPHERIAFASIIFTLRKNKSLPFLQTPRQSFIELQSSWKHEIDVRKSICSLYIYVCVCVYACMRVFVYAYICVYVYVCVYVCMCVCICMYVCAYTVL